MTAWPRPRLLLALSLVGTMQLGCGGGGVRTPPLDPAKAAENAIAEYDADASGGLSADEAAACPAISNLFSEYDANGDGQVSADEIGDRITQLKNSGVGLMAVACYVIDGGRPVANATVRFTPEPFLGGAVNPASGVTDATGRADMSVAEELLPKDRGGMRAIAPGIYRIEIEHPSVKASDKKYGVEVNPIRRGAEQVQVVL